MSVTVTQLQNRILEMKDHVDRHEALKRLEKNKDFKSLFLDYYTVTDCARMVRASVDLALSKEDRDEAIRMAQAAAYLRHFLSVIHRMGDQAVTEIEQSYKAIEEIANEPVEQEDGE